MDEEQEIPKPEPKISDVEIILVGVFYGVLDLVDLIPIAGDVTDIIAAPMGFYYWTKGITATTFIVAEVLDLIPLVQEIPSRTIGWGIAVWLDRHPKALGKLAVALEVTDALEGNIEEAEEMRRTTEAARGPDADTNAGEAGLGNIKPSEKTTESDAEAQSGKPSEEQSANAGTEEAQERSAEGEETQAQTPQQEEMREEERRTKAGDERYKELTEPEGAKNPVEEAKKKYFAAPEPIRQQPAQDSVKPNNVISGDRFVKKQRDIQQEQEARLQKEEDERRELEKPKPPETIIEDQAA